MPCNSDYLNQTPFEAKMQLTSKLCTYLAYSLRIDLPQEILREDTYYAKDVGQVEWLCNILTNLTPEQMNQYVYDGRNSTARQRATWWDEHQEADRQRELQEKLDQENSELREQAKKKLTEEEIKALGI